MIFFIFPMFFISTATDESRCLGRNIAADKPLFPCYLFAHFNLQERYFDVKYLVGVNSLISIGGEPVVVPVTIIEEIKRRGTDGIVKLPTRKT